MVIPTEEPSKTGFIRYGRSIGTISALTGYLKGGVGIPEESKIFLVKTLFIQRALDRTPDPVYGISIVSKSP